jgi:hypothetical protein
MQPRADRSCARNLVDLDRGREPLDGQSSERLDLYVSLGEGQDVGRDQDRSRHGHLLHPGGHVGRLPDRGVVHPEVGTDGAHDDLARVEPDADVHRHTLPSPQLVRVPRCPLLHPEGGVAGPHRVVLERQRRPEQGHDAVAEDLVDGPLVAVDGVHHELEDGVEERPGLLGIEVGEQLQRALDVGEEHGDLLALALEGRLRVQDALGKVAGRVPDRRGWLGEGADGAGGRGGRGRERLPASAAESLTGLVGEAARLTGKGEGTCALGTEAPSGAVVSLAAWA